MDIVERLRGEQQLQQDDYGRGLAVLDEADDEIARLRDESAKLQSRVEYLGNEVHSLHNTRATLQDESAGLRANAERYAFLREQALSPRKGLESWVAIKQLDYIGTAAEIDAAIDAAMQKGE